MKFFQILSEKDALAVAGKAKEMSWNTGKARTAELEGTVKKNSEILQDNLLTEIGKRIVGSGDVQLEAIPLKYHAPKFSRYGVGDFYKRHTDSPWMGDTRTDLSCTMWLNDDYEGGELKIGDQTFKGSPGQCVIYPCGTPHEVLPVTKGERLCVITWIQSRIRDAHKRRLVTSFRRFLSKFEDNQELFVEGGQIHSEILRMWIES